MPWYEQVLLKLGLDALMKGIRKLKSRYDKKKYAALVEGAIRELLLEHPDVTKAEAALLTAEASEGKSTALLLRAKDMLSKVKRGRRPQLRRPGRVSVVGSRTAKKKVVKRKIAKKRFSKKVVKKKAAKKLG